MPRKVTESVITLKMPLSIAAYALAAMKSRIEWMQENEKRTTSLKYRRYWRAQAKKYAVKVAVFNAAYDAGELEY